jgi:hypothetical protein
MRYEAEDDQFHFTDRQPETAHQDALVALIGQSNALGWTNNGPAPYVPTAQVMILVGDHFEVMQPGVNTGTKADPKMWGPEVGLALEWTQNTTATLYIVKVGAGETGLALNPDRLDWSPDSTGEMFDRAQAAVTIGQNLTGLTLSATFMQQGETDAYGQGTAEAYADNLAGFAQAWGSDLTIGVINDDLPFSAAVIAAQDDYEHVVVSHTTTDGIHFDAATQLALGHGFGWTLFD